jgi:hypothetical protein
MPSIFGCLRLGLLLGGLLLGCLLLCLLLGSLRLDLLVHLLADSCVRHGNPIPKAEELPKTRVSHGWGL